MASITPTAAIGQSLFWSPAQAPAERERQRALVLDHVRSTAQTYGTKLLRVELQANAEMSDQHTPRGVTYALHAQAQASPLVRSYADLGGVVSTYLIGAKSHEWVQQARRQLHSLADQMRTACDPQDTVGEHYSQSSRVYDDSFLEGAEVVAQRARVPHPYHGEMFDLQALDQLGADASVGLYTMAKLSPSAAQSNPEQERCLVVRQQFAGTSRDPELVHAQSLRDLAEGPLYKVQQQLSQDSADHLAYKVLSVLGEIDDSRALPRAADSPIHVYQKPYGEHVRVRMARSDHSNHYNTLSVVRGGEQASAVLGRDHHDDLVLLHQGTLNTACSESRGTALLVQAGQDQGYLMVPVQSRHVRQNTATGEPQMELRCAASMNSYPMGYPRRLHRSQAEGSIASAAARLGVSERLVNGAHLLDVQALPALNYHDLLEDDAWNEKLAQSGAPADPRMRILGLDAAVRTSPAMGSRVRLEELLEFHQTPDRRIRIAIDHPFVLKHMMLGVSHAVRRDRDYRHSHLELEHSGHAHFLIHADQVRHLMQCLKEEAAAAAAAAVTE